MSFTEKLEVLIETQLDSGAFRELKLQLRMAQAAMSELNSVFEEAAGMDNMLQRADTLQDKLSNIGLEINEGEGAPFREKDTGRFVSKDQARQRAFENMRNRSMQVPGNITTSMEEALRGVGEFGGNAMENALQQFSQIEQEGKSRLSGLVSEASASNEALKELQVRSDSVREAFSGNLFGEKTSQMPRRFENFKPAGMERLGNVFRNVNVAELGVLTSNMQEYGKTVNVATSGTQRFRNRALKGLDGMFQKAAGGVRSLQMRLLGLQFTMMTIAFIFTGLMASALGAVGIFEILGNTLKFLFLPTALDLLDPMLALQDIVFGLSEEMRSTIGRFVGMAAAASLVVTIAAVLGKAFLSIISPLFTLLGGATSLIQGFYGISTAASGLQGVAQSIGGPLGTIVKFFSSAGSTGSGFAGILSTLSSSFSTLMGVVSKLALPLFILFSIITGLVTIFNRFPGVVNTVGSAFKGIFNIIVGYLTYVWNVVSAVFAGITNIITGFTTFAVGALTGQWSKAVDGLEEILFGLGQIFIKPFVLFINFLIENMNKVARIAKDPFIELVNFLATHVVSKIEDFATFLPETIIDGILELAGGLESALKNVLPGWLFDMISDKLDFAGDITKTVDDFISQDFSANMKSFADNLANTENFKLFDKVKMPQIGQDFKPEETKSGGKSEEKKQQNNNTFNIEAVMQGNNESPQEMGERLGTGLADGFNNRQSNLNNGT